MNGRIGKEYVSLVSNQLVCVLDLRNGVKVSSHASEPDACHRGLGQHRRHGTSRKEIHGCYNVSLSKTSATKFLMCVCFFAICCGSQINCH